MATAVRNPAPVVEPPAVIVLTLSKHEAEVLRSLLGWNVNGSGNPRDTTDRIYAALGAADVRSRPGYFDGLASSR